MQKSEREREQKELQIRIAESTTNVYVCGKY